MTNSEENSKIKKTLDSVKDKNVNQEDQVDKVASDNLSISKEKGPLSFLSGSLTSLLFGLIFLNISKRIVIYFTIHSPTYNSAIAQSVASGFKTLVIGISFLATFTFIFIGLGLSIVFVRSLFEAKKS